ncbi:hypothetical protein ABNF65_22315 [Paenibacillus larvae]
MATPEANMFKNPKVLESADYEKAGKKGKTLLVKGETSAGNEERIILIMDNKIGIVLTSDSKDENSKKMYDELRAKFKTPRS